MVSWPDNGVQDCVRLTCSELGIGVYSTIYIFCQLRKPARRGRLGDAVKNKRRAAKALRAQSRPTAPKRAVARSPRPAKKRSAGALHKLAHPKLGQSLTPDLGWPGPVFDVSPMPMPMPMPRCRCSELWPIYQRYAFRITRTITVLLTFYLDRVVSALGCQVFKLSPTILTEKIRETRL